MYQKLHLFETYMALFFGDLRYSISTQILGFYIV